MKNSVISRRNLLTGGGVIAVAAGISGGLITASSRSASALPVSGGKTVYLTFDDGPTSYTSSVFSDLRSAGARATFFEVGSRMPGNEALIHRLLSDGHELGTHSQNHPSFWSLTAQEAYDEIVAPVQWLKSNIGYNATLFRYPYGISSRAGDTALWDLGQRPVWWNVSPPDWDTAVAPGDIISQVMSQVQNGDVIDLHDGTEGLSSSDTFSPSYLPELLDQLKSAGYGFGTLGQRQVFPANGLGIG